MNDDTDDQNSGAVVRLSLDAARHRADLDQQISTAKAYPRSVKRFTDTCMSMATLNEDVAAGMCYSLPRGGKQIEGPSIRMAEVIRQAWGNNHTGQRVIEEGDEFITAEGVFFDLESNVRVVHQVKRRITDKNGQRFNADMIGVTANAACSIAARNAILSGVPKAFWKHIYDAAKKASVGDIKTIASKRTEALGYLAKYGITEARVLASLDASGVEDIDVERLAALRSRIEAIKSKEMSIDDAFPEVSDVNPPEARSRSKGKPKTEPPQAKTKAKTLLSTDQITHLRDVMKEEGVAESSLLASFQVGKLEEISQADYQLAVSRIDQLSKQA